jgi:hypothetical protein
LDANESFAAIAGLIISIDVAAMPANRRFFMVNNSLSITSHADGATRWLKGP